MKFGLISVNSLLMWLVFVKLFEVKVKLVLLMFDGNCVKIMVVLVMVIIGNDYVFYDKLL